MSLLNEQIIESMRDKALAEKDGFFPRFFKSGPGEYGEGDQFLGVTFPDQRKVAKACFKEISLEEVSQLLENPFHEVRLTALILLVYRYQNLKSDSDRLEIVNFYLQHLEFVNNLDLVDSSGHHILGTYYWQKDKSLYYGLADLRDSLLLLILTFEVPKNLKG